MKRLLSMITKFVKVSILTVALLASGCASQHEMLEEKADMTYETSMAPDDIRDCLIEVHDSMMQFTQTKKEIVVSSAVIQGLYSPYWVLRITPNGKGSHVEVHIGLAGSPIYNANARPCIATLPPA